MSTYIYMDYYKEFSCIGGECPLTCCAGWNIKLTDDEIEMYKNLPKPFSDEVMKNIDIEKKKFILPNGRCGLLTEDGWCRIVRECGEKMLSDVCTVFPRKADSFGSFCQAVVEMVCPVVAGYMLEEEQIHFGVEEIGEKTVHDVDKLYLTLSSVRRKLVDLLQMDRGKYYRGKIFVIFKVQEYLLELYQKKAALDRKRVERYVDSYLQPEHLDTIYRSFEVVEDKLKEQVKVLTGFFINDILENHIMDTIKKYVYFDHLCKEWLVDAEKFKTDLEGFKCYYRENYLYFPENYFVYVLFCDWIPKDMNMGKFGNNLIFRIVEFSIIQISAMTIWKEKGVLNKKDYEVVISGVDRFFAHSNEFRKIVEKNVKELDLMEALLLLVF